jgi:L-2,4-diaminobutyrate decarboxylase
MKHPNPIIEGMFGPEHFSKFGHALIDILAKHLELNLSGVEKVLNWHDPIIEDLNWQSPPPNKPLFNSVELLNQLQDILKKNLAIHHPHSIGHQVSPPLPIAALCDLVASLTNQAMAVYEAGPSATMLERQVIRWLCNLIDKSSWSRAGGVLTSGGAQANLTALLVARQVSTSRHAKHMNVWRNGLNNNYKIRILASEHSHYSISRAAGIMGLGSDSVIKVSANKQGHLDLDALIDAHKTCLNDESIVIAVVANAGCTATGSIDPLLIIGEYCNQNGLWLHVDGAHGASSLLSTVHRGKLNGIQLADSIVWDSHKLMYMPAMVSAVLFKEEKHSFAAFNQEASYLFQGESDQDEIFNTSYRTLECTKRMMALKMWASFSLYGTDGLGSLIEEVYAQAQLFAKKIESRKDFELLMMPETNIVCFRYLSHKLDPNKLNRLQSHIRRQLIKSGSFHLSQVDIHAHTWLRSCIMNPFTSAQDLDDLLNNICEVSHNTLEI